MGEGLSGHPRISHKWEVVMMLAHAFKWSPHDILNWDSEVFEGFVAYTAGKARGAEIRRGK